MRSIVLILLTLFAVSQLSAQSKIDAYFTKNKSVDQTNGLVAVDLVMKNISTDTQRVEWFMASLGQGTVDPRIWIDDTVFYFSSMSQGWFPETTSYILLPPSDSVFATIHIDKRYSSIVVRDSMKFTYGTATFIPPNGVIGSYQTSYHEFTNTLKGIAIDSVYAVEFTYLKENSAVVDSIYGLLDLQLKSQRKYPLRQEDIVDISYPPKDSLAEFLSAYSHVITFDDSRTLFRFYDESYVDINPINFDFVITDIKDEGTDLVSTLSIDNLYPNPFNPTTTLQYSLSQAGIVQLSIYTIQGQRVISYPAKRLGTGQYSQQINMSSLTSGSYIIKLQHGDVVLSRKVQLVK